VLVLPTLNGRVGQGEEEDCEVECKIFMQFALPRLPGRKQATLSQAMGANESVRSFAGKRDTKSFIYHCSKTLDFPTASCELQGRDGMADAVYARPISSLHY
jgi:hypothetical protein